MHTRTCVVHRVTVDIHSCVHQVASDSGQVCGRTLVEQGRVSRVANAHIRYYTHWHTACIERRIDDLHDKIDDVRYGIQRFEQ